MFSFNDIEYFKDEQGCFQYLDLCTVMSLHYISAAKPRSVVTNLTGQWTLTRGNRIKHFASEINIFCTADGAYDLS